jgi:hypothetical protein
MSSRVGSTNWDSLSHFIGIANLPPSVILISLYGLKTKLNSNQSTSTAPNKLLAFDLTMFFTKKNSMNK